MITQILTKCALTKDVLFDLIVRIVKRTVEREMLILINYEDYCCLPILRS